jgi:hypothetical protein
MFQPFNLQPPKIDPFKKRARKQAREKLSRVAQQYRVTWKEVLNIAMKTFGKDSGFSISECETLIKEIKKGGYRTIAEHLREHLEAVSKHSINQSNQANPYDAHDIDRQLKDEERREREGDYEPFDNSQ